MNAPEVRLSPNGQVVAVRNRDSKHWPWALFCAMQGSHCAEDAEVADWTPLLPVASEDEPYDIALPGGRYYGRWIKVDDHAVTLECGCGYASAPEHLPPVLDHAADELHRGH